MQSTPTLTSRPDNQRTSQRLPSPSQCHLSSVKSQKTFSQNIGRVSGMLKKTLAVTHLRSRSGAFFVLAVVEFELWVLLQILLQVRATRGAHTSRLAHRSGVPDHYALVITFAGMTGPCIVLCQLAAQLRLHAIWVESLRRFSDTSTARIIDLREFISNCGTQGVN
eukprot:COSAG02_NODE_2251_length_9362_cov_19.062075_10_plen_166_part_00